MSARPCLGLVDDERNGGKNERKNLLVGISLSFDSTRVCFRGDEAFVLSYNRSQPERTSERHYNCGNWLSEKGKSVPFGKGS